MRSSVQSLFVLVALALALPSGSPAAPAWVGAQDLSAPGGDAVDPQVALDDAGNAVAVWIRRNGRSGNFIAQAATRLAGGSWSAPQDLSAPGEDAQFPQVAVNPTGNAVAVWRLNYRGVVQAATRPAGGSWSAPQSLSTFGNKPKVALDAAGNAVAVWLGFNGTNEIVQVASRPVGGSWSAPQDLSAPGQHAASAQVALDAAGNGIAVWQRSNGANWVVQAASRSAGGSWSPPQDLSAPGLDVHNPQVALDVAGNAVAVWHCAHGTMYFGVQGASRPAGGSWSPPQDLSDPGWTAHSPQVALDAAGNGVAIWAGSNGGSVIVQAATRPMGGVWSAPQDLSFDQTAADPQIALDAVGNAVAVWSGSGMVQAATRPAGGSWSAPRSLTLPDGRAYLPQVALDAAGNGVAVWFRSNGTNSIVQAAGYDSAGPVFGGLTIPTGGIAGTALSFSVSPFDPWSTLGPGPLWMFGDGGSANGASVKHTYVAAGSYTVTVTQADTLGNRSTMSRRVRIAARKCVVPKVTGMILVKAKAAIRKGHCRTGRVGGAFSRRVKKDRVLSQKPKAGKKLAGGSKVSVVLSRGKRR